jgi:hypothetical protein
MKFLPRVCHPSLFSRLPVTQFPMSMRYPHVNLVWGDNLYCFVRKLKPLPHSSYPVSPKWRFITRNNHSIKKYLYETFQIPPNSNAQVWEDIEQSIDLALTCTIDVNMLRNTFKDKISNLKNQFHKLVASVPNSSKSCPVICQITSICTFVMSIFNGYFFLFLCLTKKAEHSSSLLDLILVNNPRTIL